MASRSPSFLVSPAYIREHTSASAEVSSEMQLNLWPDMLRE